ncbi:MAG: hypothetical protein M3407_08620 [Acidobacteriota bacterium]|nr:hypothetical protein [Acidobacteriota bacterium]
MKYEGHEAHEADERLKTNISISQLSFVIFVADFFLQRYRIAHSHGWLRLSVNRAGVLDRAFNLAGHPFTLTGPPPACVPGRNSQKPAKIDDLLSASCGTGVAQ